MNTWNLSEVVATGLTAPWTLSQSDVANSPPGFQIRLRRLQHGLSQGVDVLEVNNGRFRFSILPTRGMGLWKAELDGTTIGWNSPQVGPVHPTYVPLFDPSGLGWLEGFDEWVCRCGLESNGAPEFDSDGLLRYPLHGRIANLPATTLTLSIEGDELAITGTVDESRFHFQKLRMTTTVRTRFEQPGLSIEDAVENRSASEAEMQMLYHCNFGPPILGDGAQVMLPAKRIVPRNDWAAESVDGWASYAGPQAATQERVYLMQLHSDAEAKTHALLKSPSGDRGVSVHWSTAQLPCFTLWKNETAIQDGYVTGLEPGTNFPNPRSFEQERGRTVRLSPNATHSMGLEFAVHASTASVDAAAENVQAIAAGRTPEISQQTESDWCA